MIVKNKKMCDHKPLIDYKVINVWEISAKIIKLMVAKISSEKQLKDVKQKKTCVCVCVWYKLLCDWLTDKSYIYYQPTKWSMLHFCNYNFDFCDSHSYAEDLHFDIFKVQSLFWEDKKLKIDWKTKYDIWWIGED